MGKIREDPDYHKPLAAYRSHTMIGRGEAWETRA